MASRHGRDRREAVRPAIDELAESQQALFDALDAGFDDRRDLVLWMHKASARTLGRVPDDWARSVLASRYQTSALLDGGGPDGLAKFERDLVRDDHLLAACSESMRFIAQSSTQYTDADSNGAGGRDRTFGPQKWFAMRPSLDELIQRQRTALKEVLGLADSHPHGLESHDDLSQWVRAVVQASRGIDGGLSHEALWDPWHRQVLRADPHAVDLHLTLADDVLAVFNAAIREEASQADEAPDEEPQQQNAFQT